MCGIFYFPWHRHQIEGTIGYSVSSERHRQCDNNKSFNVTVVTTIFTPVLPIDWLALSPLNCYASFSTAILAGSYKQVHKTNPVHKTLIQDYYKHKENLSQV